MNSLTRSHVCGVTCHPGGATCNGYCKDAKIPAPGTYEVPLLDFGDAIRAMKAGNRVARAGWNGKGMWLCLGEGRKIWPDEFWNEHTRRYAHEKANSTPAGGDVTTEVLPYIIMKTATGEVLMGWLASQTDMLAEDWIILD